MPPKEPSLSNLFDLITFDLHDPTPGFNVPGLTHCWTGKKREEKSDKTEIYWCDNRHSIFPHLKRQVKHTREGCLVEILFLVNDGDLRWKYFN